MTEMRFNEDVMKDLSIDVEDLDETGLADEELRNM